MASNSQYIFIAAIDFGTTYSGYAFAPLSDLKNNRKEVVSIRVKNWTNELSQTHSQKTSTAILFDKAGNFVSFGFEAEQKYADLADDDKHTGYRFFKHFKMMLHGRNLLRKTQLEDDQGQPMKALDVFSAAIKYLRDDLMETLSERVLNIKDSDVKWVITVPAIWNHKAKQFMEEAAIQAGIDASHFCLAHEPEAAAIYCKYIHVRRANDSKEKTTLQNFRTGSKFMILDLGGGTVDITACQVQDDGSLIELCPRGGGPWGGTVVDEHLYKSVEDVIGKRALQSLSKHSKYDHLQLNASIQIKKQRCKSTKCKDNDAIIEEIIDLPAELLTIYEKQHGENLATALARKNGYPRIKRSKICFSHEQLLVAFEEPIKQIIKEVQLLISKYDLRVETFMMVGGFSDSPIIKQAVRDAFPDKTIIIPEETITAVMKGAVLYGYQNSFFYSRRLPYSFGITTTETYDSRKHQEARVNGFNKVEDVFCPYVLKGTTVTEEGFAVQKMFGLCLTRLYEQVEIFQTSRDDLTKTAFTYDKDFECIGVVKFTPPAKTKTVDVKMTFGIFDIKVSVRPTGSKEWTEQSFDAL